jgi:hypothetical protein
MVKVEFTARVEGIKLNGCFELHFCLQLVSHPDALLFTAPRNLCIEYFDAKAQICFVRGILRKPFLLQVPPASLFPSARPSSTLTRRCPSSGARPSGTSPRAARPPTTESATSSTTSSRAALRPHSAFAKSAAGPSSTSRTRRCRDSYRGNCGGDTR